VAKKIILDEVKRKEDSNRTRATVTAIDDQDAKTITDYYSQLVMKNYNKILNALCQSSEDFNHKLIPFEEIDCIKVIETLLTFDETELEKLMLVNRQFRLFYFLKVHELIVLIAAPVTVSTELVDRLNVLMKKVDDYETYNQLFNNDTEKLRQLDELILSITIIPRDIVKIIVDYSHLSIYCAHDQDLILNKITF
jgi:prefoldin subunit 5